MCKHRSVLPVVIHIVPPHQVRQGEGLVRAAGPGTFRPGGQGGGDFPGDLPDGDAVLRQVGLAAAGVDEQDLAQVPDVYKRQPSSMAMGVTLMRLLMMGMPYSALMCSTAGTRLAALVVILL